MNKEQFAKYVIPKEKFAFASAEGRLHDKKLETKPVGYFKDAFRRFCRNKGSVVAAIIILCLVLFAIIGPVFCPKAYQDAVKKEKTLISYKELYPKLNIFEGTGFWDGTRVREISGATYDMYNAMEVEMGRNAIQKQLSVRENEDAFGYKSTLYKVRVDTYKGMMVIVEQFEYDKYVALQQWQKEHPEYQVILPAVNTSTVQSIQTIKNGNPSIWYKIDNKGNAIKTASGDYQNDYVVKGTDDYDSTRVKGDPGIEDPNSPDRFRYASRSGSPGKYSYTVRLDPYNYFIYKYNFEPSFVFGTDASGYDIISRLAKGARFSLLFALAISTINLTIGAIYGAIEGYYGGVADMIMERLSDLLSGIPFTVVAILFNLHLASKVGTVPTLVFAFVLTGWIGMASSTRMQFYRFKNQEYVLAARTLGAKDWRIIWKHIFPNCLGTLITSCVLVIPGVIFSETSLTYLGIVNLDGANMSSVGAMLSAGQGTITRAPHILLFPSLFIALLEISFNLFGNGLRDAFNPSLRGTED